MSKGRRGSLLALLLCLSFSAQAQMTFNQGLWEFDVHYDFIGVPQSFPGFVTRQCMTDKAPIPSISRPGQECAENLQGRFGRTFTWQLNCSTEWEIVNGMGRVHYMGDKATGDVHLQVVNPYNPPQPMLFSLRGKRIGDCDN